MIIEELVKGTLVTIEDNGYTIEDEDGQEIPNCINITSLKLTIGEVLYVITFQNSRTPIIIGTLESDTRDKTIEEVIDENKIKINNLENALSNLKEENELILKQLNINKKYIEEIETKMLQSI